MLSGLFKSRKPAPRAPAGSRIYAIGDIHGRSDLLADLRARILADAAGAGAARLVAVYIGDYVDRGMDSRGVIDMLLDAPLRGFESVHLIGNHEDMLLQFLDDSGAGPLWLGNGGGETLISYGVAGAPMSRGEGELERMRLELRKVFPVRHAVFLKHLAHSHVEGDYLFVHAGVRPGLAADRQSPDDMMWIRGEFLDSRADHGKIVVHGHSISGEPEIRRNRIGIDTGAFATGRLTCLVLDGEEQRFLTT